MTTDSDPQFTARYVLKPYLGFEAVYQGQSVVAYNVALTPDGVALDAAAGQPGYAANLVKALSVPMGARVVVKFPYLVATGLADSEYYTYGIIWRERSLADYIRTRTAWHNASDREGVPDTGDPRFVVSAAWQSVVYNQTEPVTPGKVSQHLRPEWITPYGNASGLVFAPDGSVATIQQGVAPADAGSYKLPKWLVYETQAAGDEMLIVVTRNNDAGLSATWDFAGVDTSFSNFYGEGVAAGGYPDLGVHVLIGKSP